MDNETANTLRRILRNACNATRPAITRVDELDDDAFLEYAGRAQEHARRAVFVVGYQGVTIEIVQVNLRARRVELVAEVHGTPAVSVEI